MSRHWVFWTGLDLMRRAVPDPGQAPSLGMALLWVLGSVLVMTWAAREDDRRGVRL